MTHYFIGADNGLSGAAAVLFPNGRVKRTFAFPTMSRGTKDAHVTHELDAVALLALIREILLPGDTATAMIERPFASDKIFIGMVGSMFQCYGALNAVFRIAGCEVLGVVPRVWKKRYGLKSSKAASLKQARALFPEVDLRLAASHNLGDALLIAEHLRLLTVKPIDQFIQEAS